MSCYPGMSDALHGPTLQVQEEGQVGVALLVAGDDAEEDFDGAG